MEFSVLKTWIGFLFLIKCVICCRYVSRKLENPFLFIFFLFSNFSFILKLLNIVTESFHVFLQIKVQKYPLNFDSWILSQSQSATFVEVPFYSFIRKLQLWSRKEGEKKKKIWFRVLKTLRFWCCCCCRLRNGEHSEARWCDTVPWVRLPYLVQEAHPSQYVLVFSFLFTFVAYGVYGLVYKHS